MLKRMIQTGLLGTFAAVVMILVTAQAQAQTWAVFRGEQVLQVQPATQTAVQFLQGGIFAFNTADRKTFLYYPPGYFQLGLPPYIGAYKVENTRVIFQAAYNLQTKASSASGQLQGTLDLNPLQATMNWTASSLGAGALSDLGGIGGPTALFGSNALGSKQGVVRVGYLGAFN